MIVRTHYGYSRAYGAPTLYLYFEAMQSLPELLLSLVLPLYLIIRQGKSSNNTITIVYQAFQLSTKKILMKADELVARYQLQYQGPMGGQSIPDLERDAIGNVLQSF